MEVFHWVVELVHGRRDSELGASRYLSGLGRTHRIDMAAWRHGVMVHWSLIGYPISS